MSYVTVTAKNFEEEVLKSDIPVLVDFWATWCGPCQMLAPVLEEIAEEYKGRVKVAKVNVDEQQQLAMQFRVSAIPTVLLFKDGNPVDTSVGFRGKAEIEAMLK